MFKKILTKPIILIVILGTLIYGGWVLLFVPIKAPETEFHLIDNQAVSLNQLKGQVVILNFWATDCVSCIAEMPALSQIYQNNKSQGLELIAVAVARDNPEKVVRFAQKQALPFKVTYDATGQIADKWGPIRVTPTTIIIDRKGRVTQEITGKITQGQLEEAIRAYL